MIDLEVVFQLNRGKEGFVQFVERERRKQCEPGRNNIEYFA